MSAPSSVSFPQLGLQRGHLSPAKALGKPCGLTLHDGMISMGCSTAYCSTRLPPEEVPFLLVLGPRNAPETSLSAKRPQPVLLGS